MLRKTASAPFSEQHQHIPTSSTSHPDDPVPHEPEDLTEYHIPPWKRSIRSSRASRESSSSFDSTGSDTLSTPPTEPQLDDLVSSVKSETSEKVNFTADPRKRRASTTLISKNGDELWNLLGESETGTTLLEKYCCGGGCCSLKTLPMQNLSPDSQPVEVPNNEAFRSLNLTLGPLSPDAPLSKVTPLPPITVSFESVPRTESKHESTVSQHPPEFLQPHPPYKVFSAPVFNARELTKPGAAKRTFHYDLDVSDYPEEGGVEFKVGGAIGICPPNHPEAVDEILILLGVPKHVRDKRVLLRTSTGRWPTIWAEEKARELVTTRRELLSWCSDIQSYPPTKQLLRVLAEYAEAKNEKKILTYLCSAEGQATFCDLRTGPHITVAQILHAFPSSRPPLEHLLSVLNQLMPRFYSLSNDPHVSSSRDGLAGRLIVEMAVTIHQSPDWRGGHRTGVGSGFLERVAQSFISSDTAPKLSVPMFRGLMANPLSQRFGGDGPMMLVGAGVGMAPFRGFILNRLRNANCANKIWLVQGVRDSMLDELYSGELGAHEKEIKRVVQSRRQSVTNLREGAATLSIDAHHPSNGQANRSDTIETGQDIDEEPLQPTNSHSETRSLTKTEQRKEARYVQDELRLQADLVWYVINAIDGRIFVCGSSTGMGEGVERALVDVAIDKGKLNEEQAKEFWEEKKTDGQYIVETW